MKKVKRVLVLALFLGAACYSAGATAQMGRGMMGGMDAGKMPMEELAYGGMGCQCMDLVEALHQWANFLVAQKEELGLTDSQLDKIQPVLNSHMKYAIRKNADRKVLLIEIQEAMVKDKVNLGEVEGKIKALEALNTEMSVQGVRTLEETLGILTLEQQKRAKALFKTSTCMKAMRMGGMHGGVTGGHMMQEMKDPEAEGPAGSHNSPVPPLGDE